VEQYQAQLSSNPNASPVEQARAISANQLTEAEVLVPAMKDLNKLQAAIYENLQAAMLGEKEVEQAVADAAQMWDSL